MQKPVINVCFFACLLFAVTSLSGCSDKLEQENASLRQAIDQAEKNNKILSSNLSELTAASVEIKRIMMNKEATEQLKSEQEQLKAITAKLSRFSKLVENPLEYSMVDEAERKRIWNEWQNTAPAWKSFLVSLAKRKGDSAETECAVCLMLVMVPFESYFEMMAKDTGKAFMMNELLSKKGLNGVNSLRDAQNVLRQKIL